MAEFGKTSEAKVIRPAHEFRREAARAKNRSTRYQRSCPECGCTEVQVQFWASWNIAEQKWVIVEEVDEGGYPVHCPDCCDTYETYETEVINS